MSSLNATTSSGIVATADNTGLLQLQSAGTTSATFNTFGIGLGTAVPSSGIGITFPATQVPSADANTLDDYEEGTWTPTIQGLSTAGTASYTARHGFYTKIGNLVTLNFYIAYNSATGTGGFSITGLPFASAGSNNFSAGAVMTQGLDWPTGTTMATLFKPEGSSVLEIYCSADNSGWVQQTMDSAADLIACITYRTA